MDIERPLDLLDKKKGKEILLQLKNHNNILKGKLRAFDIHINLVVEIKGTPTFFKGDNVLWIE